MNKMRYPFCPKCGGRLRLNENNETSKPPICTSCGFIFYKNPTAGVAVLVLRDGKVLLGKRRRGYSYEGLWCVPCGHVEWEEDVNDAATREFKEETGLTVDITSVYTVTSNYGERFIGTGFHKPAAQSVLIWYFGKIIGGQLAAGDDLEEVKFFSYSELPVLAFPTHEFVLNKLRDDHFLE
ncbi:NUDIX hydrolase [Paenibacillus sp. H1-7]|uniref:NUDIX hydrolase n=2 Tax=unclassified Paenibacillus TaxID=185978 RepID=UPI0031F333AE